MRNGQSNTDAFFLGFLAVLVGFGVSYLIDEQLKRHGRIQGLRKQLDTGPVNDFSNIQNDWSNIRNDVQKAYKKLQLEQLNETI